MSSISRFSTKIALTVRVLSKDSVWLSLLFIIVVNVIVIAIVVVVLRGGIMVVVLVVLICIDLL